MSYKLAGVVINAVFRLFHNGTVKMSAKNKYVFGLYIFLLIIMIMSWLYDNILIVAVVIAVIIVVAIISGIVYYRKHVLPDKKLRAFFNGVFKEIKLETKERTPYYLSKKVASKYIIIYSFKTYFPLKMWLAKRDYLEMYMKEKIVDIKQDEQDKTIINILVENEPLPKRINWDDRYISKNDVLNIGISRYGVVGMDLDKYPHAFVAGATGSGKSNILKCFIHQSLCKGYNVVLIDFKRGVSFCEFEDEVTIYYDYTGILEVLKSSAEETISRLDRFRYAKVDNIKDYNQVADTPLKKIIIFIDELAELLKTRDKEIANILGDSIETLTRLSRAAGIHLIMGIQRPDSTIVNGQIKNNVSYRVCGWFVDKEPSKIMLACNAANELPIIKGRVVIKDDNLREVQSFLFPKGVVRDREAGETQGAENGGTAKPKEPIQPEAMSTRQKDTIPKQQKDTTEVADKIKSTKKASKIQNPLSEQPTMQRPPAKQPATQKPKLEQPKIPRQFNFDFSDLRDKE